MHHYPNGPTSGMNSLMQCCDMMVEVMPWIFLAVPIVGSLEAVAYIDATSALAAKCCALSAALSGTNDYHYTGSM